MIVPLRQVATDSEVRFKMRSRKTKFVVAAVAAVLLTTLAVARTEHTRAAAPEAQTHETHGKVTGTSPQPNAGSHVRGLLACGDEMSETDCEKLQMLLPM